MMCVNSLHWCFVSLVRFADGALFYLFTNGYFLQRGGNLFPV